MDRVEALRALRASDASRETFVAAARWLALIPTNVLSEWFDDIELHAQIAAAPTDDAAEQMMLDRYWDGGVWH